MELALVALHIVFLITAVIPGSKDALDFLFKKVIFHGSNITTMHRHLVTPFLDLIFFLLSGSGEQQYVVCIRI